MGRLTLPVSGVVYVDTAPLIYTVERHADYEFLLLPLWVAVENGTLYAATSELALLETLVKPLRDGDAVLAGDYETLLTATRLRLQPITAQILKEAAQLRATSKLKTPDSIHAATALALGCVQFITNDEGFRKISSLPVTVLKDLL